MHSWSVASFTYGKFKEDANQALILEEMYQKTEVER